MLRALGRIYRPFAVISSYVALVAFMLLLGVPGWSKATTMPLFGGTVYAFVHDTLPFIIGAWLGANFLSGRWPVEWLAKADLWSSRITFWGIVAIAAWIGLSGNYAQLDRELGIVLLVGLGIAYFDLWHMKSIEFMASSLKGEMARLTAENTRLTHELAAAQAELATLRPNSPLLPPSQVGPFLMFVQLLGVSRLNPARIQLTGPEPVYLVLTPDGCVDLDIDLPEPRVKEILTGEVSKKVAKP